METVMEVKGVTKVYGNDVKALDNVSFKVKKGDVVGYLGPNGSGKTTTIKLLTNLLKPTSGSLYIKGIDVHRYPKEALRHVGALIEVPGAYDYLTPREMLTYFGRVHGMDRARIDARIKEVLSMVKLSSWEDAKIGSFSTGMQRRLVIAKAIFHEPEILILDEPVIGMDPKGMKEIRELIRDFQRRGITVFLSSHLLAEVSEVCNKVIFLDKGRMVKQDTIEHIKNGIDTQEITVTFLTNPTPADVERIATIDLVEKVEVVNGGIRIRFDGEPATGARILSELVRAGFEVASFVPKRRSLEDLYVSIVSDERGLA